MNTDKPTRTLIIGLGNPGKRYEWTRHNAGFLAVDAFARAHHAAWKKEKKTEALTARLPSPALSLVMKPITFMNRSGDAVRAVMRFYEFKPEDVLLVYDDIDLPFGAIRTRLQGKSGGHNGVSSVLTAAGTNNIKRIRIGIANPDTPAIPAEQFVLSRFQSREKNELKNNIFPEVIKIINLFLDAREFFARTYTGKNV